MYATQEAFKNLELEIPSEEEILKVMNQPLEEGFKYLVNKDVTKAQVEAFIQAYHQYYDRYEVHHLKEYAGISEMLQLLHNKKKNSLWYPVKIRCCDKALKLFGTESFYDRCVRITFKGTFEATS